MLSVTLVLVMLILIVPDLALRTLRALTIFSPIQNLFLSQVLVIIFLAFISSAVLYFVCKPFVDKLNFKYWVLLLISPCLLLYTNVPSKELIFFSIQASFT